MKNKNEKNGLTIIELIITSAVLAVGLLSVVSIIVGAFRQTMPLGDELTASYLAQEGFEVARRIRDSNFNEKYDELNFESEDHNKDKDVDPIIDDINAFFIRDLEYRFEADVYLGFSDYQWDFEGAVDEVLEGGLDESEVTVAFDPEYYGEELEIEVTGTNPGSDDLKGWLRLPDRWDKRLIPEGETSVEGNLEWDSTEIENLPDPLSADGDLFDHGLGGDFEREIIIEKRTYDDYPDGEEAPYLLVTVIVTWEERGEEREYTAQTKLFNWY